MSKEEFMKIQTYVLKVNIHCDGCHHKVKKILQKIDGVFTTKIDSELGKVTVSGNVDPSVLIKKLAKAGKHAELWGAQKANNQNNLANQFKNTQLDNGKGGNNNNKGQKGGNNNNQQPKGGGQPNPQQLQQLLQMKGFQDLKLPPQFKDMKMPNIKEPNPGQKAVKFNLPEEDVSSDFDDDEYDGDDFDDDEYDDELDEPHPQLNETKPIMTNGPQGLPHSMMMMMNGNHPQLVNTQKGPQNGGQSGYQNGKKSGGGGPVPVQVNMASEGKNGNAGKKGGSGGNNGGNNQNQGGKAGKNGEGMAHDGKNGNHGGGGKNGNNGGGGGANLNMNDNGGKKGNNGGGGMGDVGNGFPNMGVGGHPGMAAAAAAAAAAANGRLGQMGNIPMGQMGNMPIGQMGNIPAVQGLPAVAMNSSTGGGAEYFQGAGPNHMPGNPYHQQQQQQQQYMAAAMMNQQHAMGNERFQPMMYARPPAAVNYMPQHPCPYPYPNPYAAAAPPQDPTYQHFFSDENTSSCNVM